MAYIPDSSARTGMGEDKNRKREREKWMYNTPMWPISASHTCTHSRKQWMWDGSFGQRIIRSGFKMLINVTVFTFVLPLFDKEVLLEVCTLHQVLLPWANWNAYLEMQLLSTGPHTRNELLLWFGKASALTKVCIGIIRVFPALLKLLLYQNTASVQKLFTVNCTLLIFTELLYMKGFGLLLSHEIKKWIDI